jgi:hypothetical protein
MHRMMVCVLKPWRAAGFKSTFIWQSPIT